MPVNKKVEIVERAGVFPEFILQITFENGDGCTLSTVHGSREAARRELSELRSKQIEGVRVEPIDEDSFRYVSAKFIYPGTSEVESVEGLI